MLDRIDSEELKTKCSIESARLVVQTAGTYYPDRRINFHANADITLCTNLLKQWLAGRHVARTTSMSRYRPRQDESSSRLVDPRSFLSLLTFALYRCQLNNLAIIETVSISRSRVPSFSDDNFHFWKWLAPQFQIEELLISQLHRSYKWVLFLRISRVFICAIVDAINVQFNIDATRDWVNEK